MARNAKGQFVHKNFPFHKDYNLKGITVEAFLKLPFHPEKDSNDEKFLAAKGTEDITLGEWACAYGKEFAFKFTHMHEVWDACVGGNPEIYGGQGAFWLVWILRVSLENEAELKEVSILYFSMFGLSSNMKIGEAALRAKYPNPFK